MRVSEYDSPRTMIRTKTNSGLREDVWQARSFSAGLPRQTAARGVNDGTLPESLPIAGVTLRLREITTRCVSLLRRGRVANPPCYCQRTLGREFTVLRWGAYS